LKTDAVQPHTCRDNTNRVMDSVQKVNNYKHIFHAGDMSLHFSSFLRNPKITCRSHNRSPYTKLSHFSPFRHPHPCFFRIHLNILPLYSYIFQVTSSIQVSRLKCCTRNSTTPVRAKCCNHHNFLNFNCRNDIKEMHK
jgi:hypothetical protein